MAKVKSLIGRSVVVERIGEPPCDAVVVAVNEVTGIITTVRMKDKSGFDIIVDVSNAVVRLVSPLREIWLWLRGWFK